VRPDRVVALPPGLDQHLSLAQRVILHRIGGGSFTGDGAYDRATCTAGAVAECHPDAVVVVPPRLSAVPSETAETALTQRDRHLRLITERGRLGWQGRRPDIPPRFGPRRRSAATSG
jgi:hypothetical protein